MTYVELARLFGVVFTVTSLGVLFNLDNANRIYEDLKHSAMDRFLVSLLSLLLGMLVLSQHFSFAHDWGLAVTILGWVMVINGVFCLLFVNAWVKIIQFNQDKGSVLFCLFGLLIGFLMLYIGFAPHIGG